jgi:DNA polymerase I-like protein with 3'-5' exonuclease and polymerase domains
MEECKYLNPQGREQLYKNLKVGTGHKLFSKLALPESKPKIKNLIQYSDEISSTALKSNAELLLLDILFKKIPALLDRNLVFKKSCKLHELAVLYSISRDAGIAYLCARRQEEDIVEIQYKIGKTVFSFNADISKVCRDQDRTETMRWYLYLVNCALWSNIENTYFFHIDSDEKLQSSIERVKENKHNLPLDEFYYLNYSPEVMKGSGNVITRTEITAEAGLNASGEYAYRLRENKHQLEDPEFNPIDMNKVEDKFYDLFSYLLYTQKLVACDTETTGLNVFRDTIVSLGLAFDNTIGFYISCDHSAPRMGQLIVSEKGLIRHLATLDNGAVLPEGTIKDSYKFMNLVGDSHLNLSSEKLTWLCEVLTHKKNIFHNAKFDYSIILNNTGVKLPIAMDTAIVDYITRPGYDDDRKTKAEKRGLKIVASRELGVKNWKADVTRCKDEIKDLVAAYNAKDTCYTFGLALILSIDAEINPTLFNIEHKFQQVLIEAELAGVGLDVDKLSEIRESLQAKEAELGAKIQEFVETTGAWDKGTEPYEYITEERTTTRTLKSGKVKTTTKMVTKRKPRNIFNINSGPMLKKLFFEVLGINPMRKCKKCFKAHSLPSDACNNPDCDNYNVEGTAPKMFVTKSGADKLDGEVLKLLAESGIEVAEQIHEYKGIAKLINSYMNIDRFIEPSTGRIHPTYNQTVTATGRLSSSKPNFQQLPKKAGKFVRQAITAGDPNYCIISADYEGQETKIMAACSGDEKLLKAFNPCYKCEHNPDTEKWLSQFGICPKESHVIGSKCNVLDIHSYVTKQIHGDVVTVDVSEIKGCKSHPEFDHMRNLAKSITFGLAYGGSAYGLSSKNNMPIEEARELMDKYFDTFSGVKQYIQDCQVYCDKHGAIPDMVGRYRKFHHAGWLDAHKCMMVYTDRDERKFPDGSTKFRRPKEEYGGFVRKDRRAATNFPIQGLAASMTKIAAIELHAELKAKNLDAQVIQFVHDEILISCRKDPEIIKAVVEAVRTCMTDKLNMPAHCMKNHPLKWSWPEHLQMSVEIDMGDSYGDLKTPEEYLKQNF